MSKAGTYCFIVNCASNTYRAENLFKNKEADLRELFPGSEFIYVGEEDSISSIASEKAACYSHIIACGGDGTVNQAAKGIRGTAAILGVIPLGSGNDFAKSIGLQGDFKYDVHILRANNTTQIDLVKSNWGIFLNTFGLGIDGLTNYYASQYNFKKGAQRYFLGGLKALFSSHTFPVTLKIGDSQKKISQTIWMASVANGKTEGGKYKISPDSVNYDGEVEIILVKAVSRARLLLEFLKLSVGIPFNQNVVDTYSTKSGCSIESIPGIKAHFDGEQAPDLKSYKFEVLQASLEVVVNEQVLHK